MRAALIELKIHPEILEGQTPADSIPDKLLDSDEFSQSYQAAVAPVSKSGSGSL